MRISTDKIEGKNLAGRDLIINKTIERVGVERALATSSLLLIAMIISAFMLPCPSRFQYEVFRILTAIGLFGFSSVLPNAMRLKIRGSAKVTGALLIFLVALIWNPASLLANDGCGDQLSISGTVWMGSERLAGAKVSAPLLDEVDETNSSGEFNLPFDHSLKGQSIELTVSYRQLEKRHAIAELDDREDIRIHFADTITPLTDSLIVKAVMEHLTKSQRSVKAELKKLLLKHNRKPSSRRTIEERLAIWESLEGGERNEVVFENEFLRLNTLKSMEAADLQSDYVMLATGWGMKTPQFFLINWQNEIEQGQNQSTVKLELLIFNQANDEFELLGNTDHKLQARTKHSIKYLSPLQLVHVRLEYSARTDWKRSSKIRLIGNLPEEEYWLEFKNADWEIVDATRPD